MWFVWFHLILFILPVSVFCFAFQAVCEKEKVVRCQLKILEAIILFLILLNRTTALPEVGGYTCFIYRNTFEVEASSAFIQRFFSVPSCQYFGYWNKQLWAVTSWKRQDFSHSRKCQTLSSVSSVFAECSRKGNSKLPWEAFINHDRWCIHFLEVLFQ